MSFDPQALHALLRQFFACAWSDAERKQFVRSLRDMIQFEDQLNAARNQALALVQADPTADHVVWLEGVLRMLERVRSGLNPHRSEAAFSPGSDILHLLGQQIQKADHHLRICVFTISDNVITDRLIDAMARGLKVEIITDNDKRHDTGSDIRQLRQAGAAIRMDDGPDHMHHKFALFDDVILLTGSFNWTRSASARNYENVLITRDPVLVKSYIREFKRLWTQFEASGS